MLDCKTSDDNCRCKSCADGYYLENQQCIKYYSPCKTCENTPYYCLSCESDLQYLSYKNKCEYCNYPCKKCSSQNECLSYVDNYSLFGTKYCNITKNVLDVNLHVVLVLVKIYAFHVLINISYLIIIVINVIWIVKLLLMVVNVILVMTIIISKISNVLYVILLVKHVKIHQINV